MMIVSRPCRTCRLRKKACDKTRPKCNSCYKSGRQCEGYDSYVKGVFVNLDGASIKTPMKPLITSATLLARKASSNGVQPKVQVYQYDSKDISNLSPRLLELSPAEFQNHFATLWSHFQKGYARTPGDWSIQISGLALHHKALDLALISLATMRLSVCGQGNTYRVFSLTAYNDSLQIFQKLLQQNGQESKGFLVVISLIFTLFEAAQQMPIQIYQSGWAGHLKGALFLMQRQGPSAFQTDGLHAAFKKLREMAILLAFSTSSSSFLAQSEWIDVPWAKMKKSSRDRLHDIATEMTTVHLTIKCDATSSLQLCQKLYHKLIIWRQKWLQNDYPDLSITCQGCKEEPCDCFPHYSLSPCNEVLFITAEGMAFLLMVTYMALGIVKRSKLASTFEENLLEHSFSLDLFRKRASRIRLVLQRIMALPCFGQAASDAPGITEGRCRSLFPIWVLSQDPDAQVLDDVSWWSCLKSRVSYGIQ